MKISQLRVQQSSIDPDKARAVYGVYQYEQSIHESTIMRHKDIAQRAGDLITSPGQVSHANGYMLERGIIDAPVARGRSVARARVGFDSSVRPS